MYIGVLHSSSELDFIEAKKTAVPSRCENRKTWQCSNLTTRDDIIDEGE